MASICVKITLKWGNKIQKIYFALHSYVFRQLKHVAVMCKLYVVYLLLDILPTDSQMGIFKVSWVWRFTVSTCYSAYSTFLFNRVWFSMIRYFFSLRSYLGENIICSKCKNCFFGLTENVVSIIKTSHVGISNAHMSSGRVDTFY